MSNHNLHKLVLQKFKVKIDTTISYAIQYKITFPVYGNLF